MRRPIVDANGFGLIRLESRSGVRAEFLPTGVLFALRHDSTLINQILPGPAEDGLFRLLVRWSACGEAGLDRDRGWAPLVGPGLAFACAGRHAVTWATAAAGRLAATTTFALHPELAGWMWRVHVRNVSRSALAVDVLHVQDLGLADEAAVRNNEAYVSQYLDLRPVADPTLGWMILARQNEAMAGGRHPWLAVGTATGADAFCTDGWQFFGADHRVSGEPVAVRTPSLPSRRLQYECAVAGLQSRSVELAPGAAAEITFCASYLPDHPAASDAGDAEHIHALIAARWDPLPHRTPESPGGSTSLFTHGSWLHGAAPAAAEWDAWFPGLRRHEERADDGALLAFFHGADTHVVAHAKEASVLRPHGHVLRSGEPRWVDAGHLGVTCYAAGIFAAQAFVYFSSSDADFADRLEAAARWNELRTGGVAVRGGWRLYSSGPGLYLHAIRAALLGVRESFGDVVFDPVLPRSLDGLVTRLRLHGRPVEIRYRVRAAAHGASRITVNGAPVPLETREENAYRPGGWRVPAARLALSETANAIEIDL